MGSIAFRCVPPILHRLLVQRFSWSVFVFFHVLNSLNVLNGLNSSLARCDRAQPSR